MSLDRNAFDAQLDATLEDGRLTRGERRVLQEMLGDKTLSQGDLDWIRNRVFAAVERHLKPGRERALFAWTEDVTGLLVRAQEQCKRASMLLLCTPTDDIPSHLARLIESARHTIEVCVFTVTDNRLSDALFEAKRRGTTLRIITDDLKSDDLGSDIPRMREAGVAVRADSSPNHMHHKFALFDGTTAAIGSYNWTRSAARHNHESLVISGDARLAGSLGAEFERLWSAFQPSS